MLWKKARSTGRGALLLGLLLVAATLGFMDPLGGRVAHAQAPVIDAPDVVTLAEGTTLTLSFTVTGTIPGWGVGLNPLLPDGHDGALAGPLCGGNPRQPFSCRGHDSGSVTFVFTWTPTCDDAGEYDIVITATQKCASEGKGTNCPITQIVHVIVTEAEACGGGPQYGSVNGEVTADCPAPATALLGVTVDVVEVGTGELVASAVTDVDGNYSIPDLLVGSYTTVITVPLGYTAATNENSVEVLADQDVTSSFALQCQANPSAPRTIGFWKHQFAVATSGRGTAQIDAATLCSYLDLIEGHFNSNAINQVVVYAPPVSGTCDDKLIVAKSLLNLHGSVDMIDRARQQLLALLLNAASGKVGLMNVASADGATVSQAITTCDNLIDDPEGDHEKAKTIADLINNGEVVPSGMIPLETANIAYRRAILEFAAGPSPSSGPRAFRFAMARGGHVSLAVYDVAGRRAAQVFDGELAAGRHTLAWNGRTAAGAVPNPGIYFTRLSTGVESRTLKVVEISR